MQSFINNWRNANIEEAKARKWQIASLENYHKGFHDGMSVNDKLPHTLSIMGHSFEQILKILMKHKENKMANRIIRRKEALDYCQLEGYKLFIDMLIKDNCLVWEDEPKRLVIDHVDKMPVIIKRNGHIVYEE